MNITAVRNARVILNLTVPVKNALMSIKDAPAKNAHRKFIIVLARNAHSNTCIFAAVKNVPIDMTINPVKQRPALLTAYFIFLPHALRKPLRGGRQEKR